ncbi:unnamed protein product [Moneuplotes crassus]|uniref:Cytochrome c oxidase assembly protein COX11, mitochondrial n=2 Tax=Euplotes crassus TaxID=5936 RepID=A0AAD1UHQ0_EUPCR|nr:unnamed protein product [Moneuplotes crassus]
MLTSIIKISSRRTFAKEPLARSLWHVRQPLNGMQQVYFSTRTCGGYKTSNNDLGPLYFSSSRRNFCTKPTKEETKVESKPEEEKFLQFDDELKKKVQNIKIPKAIVEEIDEDLELEKTERGQIVRERRIFLKEYDHHMHEQKWGAFYGISGICLFLLGTWSLIVPLYKLICERWGYSVKTQHTDYQEMQDKNDVFRKYRVHFEGVIEDDLPWNFEPEIKVVQVGAGETALAFYKAYNKSDKPIVGLSIYQVDPSEASLYFNKVQCFCFENQLLHPQEYVDLPVFFYLDPLINRDPNMKEVVDLTVSYHFFPAADQTVAEVVQRELEKHEKDQEELKVRRKKYGVTKEEREGKSDDAFSALPGLSPRRRSERALRQIRAIQKELGENQENEDNLEVVAVEDDSEIDGEISILDQNIFMNSEEVTPSVQPSS